MLDGQQLPQRDKWSMLRKMGKIWWSEGLQFGAHSGLDPIWGIKQKAYLALPTDIGYVFTQDKIKNIMK